jgi:hypothetical protein
VISGSEMMLVPAPRIPRNFAKSSIESAELICEV